MTTSHSSWMAGLRTAHEQEIQTTSVLIMEIEPLISMDLEQALDAHGIEVHQSRTVAEATAILEANPHIGVFLVDVDKAHGAPGNVLKNMVGARNSPLRIVATTTGSDADATAGLPIGTRICRKPFNMDQLVQYVLDQ